MPNRLYEVKKIIHKSMWIHLSLSIFQLLLYLTGAILTSVFTCSDENYSLPILFAFGACAFTAFLYITCYFWNYYSCLKPLRRYKKLIEEDHTEESLNFILKEIGFDNENPRGLKEWLNSSKITVWMFIPFANVFYVCWKIGRSIDKALLKIEDHFDSKEEFDALVFERPDFIKAVICIIVSAITLLLDSIVTAVYAIHTKSFDIHMFNYIFMAITALSSIMGCSIVGKLYGKDKSSKIILFVVVALFISASFIIWELSFKALLVPKFTWLSKPWIWWIWISVGLVISTTLFTSIFFLNKFQNQRQ